jgi:hypothetical protein
MNVKLVFVFALILAYSGHAQDDRLDEKIDEVTYAWDLEADKLATYDGLLHLCRDAEYRTEIFELLDKIHHYDTVLYNVLIILDKTENDKEIKKTIKQIKKFEKSYNSQNFIHFMKKECEQAAEIEKHAEETKNEVGANSYSGQIYMLETELYKYVKHVTNKVDQIRKHVHHLSSHYQN